MLTGAGDLAVFLRKVRHGLLPVELLRVFPIVKKLAVKDLA